MNVLSGFRSRAVRLGVVLVVAEQLQDINIEVTAYAVARALDCSHVTARKYLRELVNTRQLEKSVIKMAHCTKEVFEVIEPADTYFRQKVAKYLNSYHMNEVKK